MVAKGNLLIEHRALPIILCLSLTLPAKTVGANKGECETRYWVPSMAKVHAKFSGQKGTFAHFGDSITVTLAFWTPLLYSRKNAPAKMEQAYQLVEKYLRKECWRNWKGPQFGNQGRRTIRWAYENIDHWLKRLNPEVALIMFGTNDLTGVGLEEYQSKTRQVVQRCLDNGTVVILSTIPPRHKRGEKAAVYAEAVRKLAREMKVPLVDFHAEILTRRPDDWDGALDKFAQYKGYDVPTLLARDGVHPSHPKMYHNDYSEQALNCCGYSLRNYLVLMKYAEVVQALGLASSPKGNVTGLNRYLPPPIALGWQSFLLHKNLRLVKGPHRNQLPSSKHCSRPPVSFQEAGNIHSCQKKLRGPAHLPQKPQTDKLYVSDGCWPRA